MTMLLQRENAKNEAHLIPLRQNAKKLAFLTEATKSNDGTPPVLSLYSLFLLIPFVLPLH